MSRAHWIPFDPTDPAWSPDLSPDRTGSYRWTGAPDGVLVSVHPFLNCGATWYLPGVHFNDGRTWNGSGWLTMERGYARRASAQREAILAYKANRKRAA